MPKGFGGPAPPIIEAWQWVALVKAAGLRSHRPSSRDGNHVCPRQHLLKFRGRTGSTTRNPNLRQAIDLTMLEIPKWKNFRSYSDKFMTVLLLLIESDFTFCRKLGNVPRKE